MMEKKQEKKQWEAALLITLIAGLLIIAGIAGCSTSVNTRPAGSVQDITLYKSPSCGCCTGHAAALTRQDFTVNVKEIGDIGSIKQRFSIPSSMESCHTAVIGDYFVEGHVPMEAIDRLLEEKPDIDGIALPRMPSGTPGMPGAKREPWTIYALKDGQVSEFMII